MVKSKGSAPTGMAQLGGHRPCKAKGHGSGSQSDQAMCLGWGLSSSQGASERQPTDISLLH